MEALKESREKISELFRYGSHGNRGWRDKKLSLNTILEEKDSVVTRTPSVISNRTPSVICHEEVKKITTKPNRFFSSFLRSLRAHSAVYQYFINEGASQDIISKINAFKSSYRVRSYKSVTPQFKDSVSTDNESEISDIIKPSRSNHRMIMESHRFLFQKIGPKLKFYDKSISKITRSIGTRSVASRQSRFKGKKLGLNSGSFKTREIFDRITNSKVKYSPEDIKKYLLFRYPELVSIAIIDFLGFKTTGYEEFVNDINKFINAGEIKHLEFCFTIFDFNKDQQICYKDAFKALEIRTKNYYDSDLALINEMFELKKQGKNLTDYRLRRKSTLSLIKEKIKKNKADHKKNLEKELVSSDRALPNQQISITFKEFCMLKFTGRPQIFVDFLSYFCNFNFLKEKGFLIPSPIHSRKNSETIVVQMNISPEFQEGLMKNDKYDYYCALDSAMSLHSKKDLEDLLRKFKYLQSDDNLKFKVITKASTVKKLVKKYLARTTRI